jgi:hypothetical protein
VLRDLGVPEEEAARADRVRTAKAVKVLLAACDGKEPTKLVGAVSQAKLETNATTMGRSLKSAKPVLESLKNTRWDLFQAVSAIQGERAGDAALLIKEVASWLKTDEHALAGGLASKLSEAEGRAIKLLTPTKPPGSKPLPPDPGKKTWTSIGSGRKDRMSSQDWSTTAQQLLQKMEGNPRYRLTVEWTIEEEPQ